MKKVLIGILGVALLCAAPVLAQTSGQMSHDALIKWAAGKGACGTNSVIDAKYLPDGRVYVTCGIPQADPSPWQLGGLGDQIGSIATVVGIVVISALAAGNSTSTTN